MFGKRPTSPSGGGQGFGKTPTAQKSAGSSPAAARPAQPGPEAPKPSNPATGVAVKTRPEAEKPAAAPTPSVPKPVKSTKPKPASAVENVGAERSAEYYAIKTTIFNALIDTIDLSQLARLDNDTAAEEIRDIVTEIISIKNVAMSIAEQEQLLQDICNDVLGYGPLEPLLARDDIADIMVNGAGDVFIEVAGKVKKTNIRFRDNGQLMNICQRIVSQVGRRVDES
jgi:pilus assembly protein CpaF